MREIRPSGSEGGVALARYPYPYLFRPQAGGRFSVASILAHGFVIQGQG